MCGLVEDTWYWHCVCVSLVIEGSNDILFYWLYICDSTEEIPSSAEKVQDCDVLLEPTLLGPLRGDGSTVSLSECFSLSDCFSSTSVSLCCLYNFSDSDFCYFLFDQFSLLKNWSLQLVGLFSHYLHYICLCSSHGLCVF